MKKNTIWILALLLLFLAAALFFGLRRPSIEARYSSKSNAPDGTRALYLLLEESGFRVARREVPIESAGDGVLLVIGPEGLYSEDPQALADWEARGNVRIVLASPGIYQNQNIDAGTAYTLVSELWPYRDFVIWFDEYGRGRPLSPESDAQPTPVSVLPKWLAAMLLQLFFTLLLCLVFLGARLGPPVIPNDRKAREETEELTALAGLMERAGLLTDAMRLCYRRLTAQTGLRYPEIERRLSAPFPEDAHGQAEALALAAEMDRLEREKTL